MPCGSKTGRQETSGIPTIPWSTNDHALTWSLIGLVEEPENRKVLVGKSKDEVSMRYWSYKPPVKFSCRIPRPTTKPRCSNVFLRNFCWTTLAPMLGPLQIVSRLNGMRMSPPFSCEHFFTVLIRLRKQYQSQAKCLTQTGGGVETNGDDEDTSNGPRYQVPVTGPNDSTSPEAKNLWCALIYM
jgi:hypothetical protein